MLSPEPRSGVYRGATVAFGTRHGKHHQVQEGFAVTLGAHVIAVDDIDTDQFGTFTGERSRTGTALAAARAKIRLATDLTASPYTLASEASYGPLPDAMINAHEELLLFFDATRNIEILEGERLPVELPEPVRAATVGEATGFLIRANFPHQAVIVRPHAGATPTDIRKGITDPGQLADAIRHAARRSNDGWALIEPDLRAHHNPTRRAVLRRLGDRLAHRLATTCPACDCPGFGRTDAESGLPCHACGTPTERIAADWHSCARCPHRTREPRPETTTDPRWCPSCNP